MGTTGQKNHQSQFGKGCGPQVETVHRDFIYEICEYKSKGRIAGSVLGKRQCPEYPPGRMALVTTKQNQDLTQHHKSSLTVKRFLLTISFGNL